MSVFQGSAVALVTPMNADETVNYKKLEELLEEQIANGTDAIVSVGTTGESSTLTHEEHVKVVEYTCNVVNHRVPVIAGAGSNSTAEAIYSSIEAEKRGADAVLLVTPYYNKCTQEGLIQHYTKICNSITIPAILYNVPSRTGVNINPETMAYLYHNVKNIVGVKEASGNFSNIVKLMSMVDDGFELYSGNDDQVVPLLSLGGKGVISVLANVAPQQTHDICQSFFDGDVKKAAELQLKAVELINSLFCEVNPIPVKTALNLMGKEVGPLRLPLCNMKPENEECLKKALIGYGIL